DVEAGVAVAGAEQGLAVPEALALAERAALEAFHLVGRKGREGGVVQSGFGHGTPGLAQVRFGSRGDLDRLVVHVAPAPALVRLERGDQRVVGLVKVLSGVPVGRAVAAADVAAGQAEAQVDPPGAGLQTLLAALRGAGRDRLDG